MRRRRFLVLAASAALLGRGARADRWEWRGDALGAEARIVLTGDRDAARAALTEVAAEIERLEAIFSLHRSDSQLSRLNAEGVLTAPARDLTLGLAAATRWRLATEGAFDPAVQPLWQAAAAGEPRLPMERVAAARVDLSPGRVALSAGAALTLNGIAQGIIADRVAALLTAAGFEAPVIDTGEMQLPGRERRRVRLPEAGLDLALAQAAVATSAPGAMRLGAHHHLFDPRRGTCPDRWRTVTVVGPDATTADALSTAFAVSEPERIGDLVPHGCLVIAIDEEGSVRRFGRSEGVLG
jgi:thiamine biosynthesis lipoprotein